MTWFEDQIRARRESDQQLLEDSFNRVAGVILGEHSAQKISDERIVTKNAIDEIVKYYHFKPVDLSEDITASEEQLDACLRPHGIMYRSVSLTSGWYKDAYGPVLAFLKEGGAPVALLPDRVTGYVFNDPLTGRRTRLNRKSETRFEKEAYCFYRPLPQRKLGITDLLLYMKRCISLSDGIMIAAASYIVAVVGILTPRITMIITGPVLKSRQMHALAAIAVCLVCVSVSTQLFTSCRDLIMKRLEIKTTLGVQSSMMMRILSLPASFFRQYSPGELKSRSTSVNRLCSLLMGMVLSAGITSLSSLLYVTQIFRFASALVVPSLIIILITVGFSACSTLMQIQINRRQMEIMAREAGMSYQMITGVQKVKLAGAEKRLFARWLNLYADGAELTYDPPVMIKLNNVISTGIGLFSNLVIYYLAVRSGLEPAAYFAFTAAYGVVMGAFSSLSGTALMAAEIRPILEMAEPFLKAEPETTVGKERVTDISGSIELDHVSFRYSEETPYVVKDLSLKIRSGEYTAIVGRTGCGKSTLMRLLLGFEKPEKGSIYYDGRDLQKLDLPSLRKKIGTVTQNGGLFQGDIYSNIVISAPQLSLEDAWEAAEKAGIAEDIRRMPMGMHTLISEGQGGISGGQKQRLMIARAIAPRPKVLMFDEATSALDNRTQKQVTDALDAMGCTRIVIAHRLSTIRHCDRILVLDGGKIIEDGTYEELIRRNGFFAQLVERQRLDGSNE